jgi:MFS family permease
LLGGILGLAVAMGIGRFAFTPILPAMEAEAGLKHFLAGQIASWNYLGYLLGTLLFGYLAPRLSFRLLYPASLALSCLTTCAMALTGEPFWWGVLRFLGGVASCLLFVAIASQVSAELGRHGRPLAGSLLFSGVGLGIAFTGAVTDSFTAAGGWRGSWAGMGGCAIALSLVSLYFLRHIKESSWRGEASKDETVQGGNALLTAAYFLEGLGYIVTATFLVAIVKQTPGLSGYASASWVVVGLSAAASPLCWQTVAARIGRREALTAAYLIQAAGMYAGIYLTGPGGLFLSAASFGGTFIGITWLAIAEGTSRERGHKGKIVAVLTFAFALGQIIGPPCAGWVAQMSQGFALTLKIAAACILLAALLIWLDRPTKEKVSCGNN